ncbi:MAG: HEAT repeat domain-containing protein [Myxococcota bacterium]|nr:HEAT repeat domain-containing protein [Myxococcota bacterium]
MGLLDFLTGGEEGQVRRHTKRLVNINAQAEDREISSHWLAEHGGEEAVLGLLGRFGMSLEHHMKDKKEKDLVFDLLLSMGDQVVQPTSLWIQSAQSFAQPLRIIEHFRGPEEVVSLLLELIVQENDPFKPEKKRQLLIKLAEYKDDRIQDTIESILEDFDEGVRYAAAEALLAQDDETVRLPLAAVLGNPEEESNRIKVRLASAFHQRGWSIGEHADSVAKYPPVGWIVEADRLRPE